MSIRKWLAALLTACMLCSMLPGALMESDSGEPALIIEDALDVAPETIIEAAAEGLQSDAVDASIEEEAAFDLVPNGSPEFEAEPAADVPAEVSADDAVIANDSPLADFEFDTNNVVTKYKGTETTVIVPEQATAIGPNAFENNQNIVKVILQGQVTSIGDRAFSGCTKLEYLRIPDSVTSIGEYAFATCRYLEFNDNETLFKLPKELTSLGQYAFSGCIYLRTVEIPNTLKEIPDYAFANNYRLESVKLPEGVTTIGSHAFDACTAIKSLSIPKTVTQIGSYAFNACNQIETLALVEGLTTIGEYAFGDTSSLAAVSIPKTVTGIGANAFKQSGLKTLTVAEGVAEIGAYAFNECDNLAALSLPKSVKSLGEGAFSGNDALKSVTFAGNVATVGAKVFGDCSALDTVTLSEDFNAVTNGMFTNCTALKEIALTLGATAVGESAFRGCTGLQKVTLPGSVLAIEADAFRDCTCLVTFAFPSKLASIGDYAFSGCANLATVKLPDTVKTIGDYAFEKCSLTSLTLNTGLTAIGRCAFSESGLSEVKLPTSLTTIGASAFEGAANLSTVTLPDTVTTIEDRAFNGCSALEELLIPASVTTFGGSRIFEKCHSDFRIRCIHDSAAEAYAKENNIPLVTSVERFVTVRVKSGSEPSKEYDGTTGGTVKASDFEVNPDDIAEGDTVTVTKASAEFTKATLGQQNVKVTFEISSTSRQYVYKLRESTMTFKGSIVARNITVTPAADQGKALNEADPVFAYTHDDLIGTDAITGALGRAAGETVGTYKYTLGTLTAGTNYKLVLKDGPVFTITEKSLAKCTVAAIPAQVYSGKALEPAVTVMDGATRLTLNKDYKVTYANNIEMGTATVTIRGIGAYGGTLTASFTIGDGKTSITDASIKMNAIPEQYYTGVAITPTVTLKQGSTTLKQGTDYTVTYSNNIYEGTADVVITGMGNYKGTRTEHFTIIEMLVVEMSRSKSVEVAVGQRFMIEVTGDHIAESFKSSRSSVCEVLDSDSGIILPGKEGTAKITIKLLDSKKKYTLTVKVVDPYKPTKIKLSAETKEIDLYEYAETGEGLAIEYDLTPETAESEITWKSSNKKIAEVSDGEVIPYKEGRVTITATTVSGKKKDTIRIKVTNNHAPRKIWFVEGTKGTYALDEEEVTLTVTGEGKDGAEMFTTLEWSSSKKSVASISESDDESATIALHKKGSAKITAKASNGKKATFNIKVVTEVLDDDDGDDSGLDAFF